MGTDAAPVTDAQPDAPQGADGGQGEGTLTGLYDLSTAPEELRPALEQELKKITANVDRKFREAADFRKKYEPLEGIEGIHDVPAEDLKGLMELYEIFSDEESLTEWTRALATELGVVPGETTDADPDSPEGEGDDPVAQLTQTVQALQAKLDAIEQGSQQSARAQQIDEELSSLAEKHKGQYGDDAKFDQLAVIQLAHAYPGDPEGLSKGYDDWLRISGQAQSDLVEDKLDQPAAALNGGRVDTTPEPITSFEQARAAATQRFQGT